MARRTSFNSGTWNDEEETAFLQIITSAYGKDYDRLEAAIPTRSRAQIRAHTKSYFQRMDYGSSDWVEASNALTPSRQHLLNKNKNKNKRKQDSKDTPGSASKKTKHESSSTALASPPLMTPRGLLQEQATASSKNKIVGLSSPSPSAAEGAQISSITLTGSEINKSPSDKNTGEKKAPKVVVDTVVETSSALQSSSESHHTHHHYHHHKKGLSKRLQVLLALSVLLLLLVVLVRQHSEYGLIATFPELKNEDETLIPQKQESVPVVETIPPMME